MIVALLRHGRTAWNDAGRMQGRADVPLSEVGRTQVRGWRLPTSLADGQFVASPLARARETAALLGAQPFGVDGALIEMDWGEWEGETLAALKARHGEAFASNAARGLDFRPPGGESPRDVQRRVVAWLTSLVPETKFADRPPDRCDQDEFRLWYQSRVPLIAVTHQGVIRSVISLATGWDMTTKPPVRLADDVVHVVEVEQQGVVRALAWNVTLVAGPVSRRRPR